jgi:hypothetical protein
MPNIDVGRAERPEVLIDRWLDLQVPHWYRELASRFVSNAFGVSPEQMSLGLLRPREGSIPFEWYFSVGDQIEHAFGRPNIEKLQRVATRARLARVCFIKVLSLTELEALAASAPQSLYNTQGLPGNERGRPRESGKTVASCVKNELAGLDLLPVSDPVSFSELAEVLGDKSRDRWYVALQADLEARQALGLSATPQKFLSDDVAAVQADRVTYCLNALTRMLVEKRAFVLVVLTVLPPPCLHRWMREEKRQEFQDAVRESLKSFDLSGAEFSLAPREQLSQFHSVWVAVRTEIKSRLEAVIAGLQNQRFETFDEKADVAAEINQVLDDWGFRAISPSTGRAAYFFCRGGGKRNPNGFFAFEDIDSESVPVGPVQPDAPRATVHIHPFRLTDVPPDSRVRDTSRNANKAGDEKTRG